MNTDTTQVLNTISGSDPFFSNIWLWIALVEFCVIIALLYLPRRGRKRQNIKQDILSGEEVDYNNLNESFFKAKPLYDVLKKKCHPDRFTNPEKNKIATDLFQHIHQNRHDYKKLCNLRECAIKELNINF